MPFQIQGAITTSATTVTTTAIAIPATAATGRRTMLVFNNGTVTVYLGASNVTVATGYPLQAGDEKSYDLDAKVTLYGITDSSTADVRTFEGT